MVGRDAKRKEGKTKAQGVLKGSELENLGNRHTQGDIRNLDAKKEWE
jgi:hypothetical protein